MLLTPINLAITRLQSGTRNAPLSLDFTSGNQTLDPRITFSRTSNATVTDSSGVLTYAPHNLLTYSEQFDNSAWSKTGGTVSANTVVAPDGTQTADTLVEDTSTGGHNIVNNATVADNTVVTASAYIKAAGRSWVAVVVADKAGASNRVWFNVSTGTQGTTNGTVTAFSATDVGNGWYRIAVSASVGTGAQSPGLRVSVGSADNTASYTGNGAASIYIWGAQLNVGSLQPYYPTTVKNLLGYTQEFDNAAWGKANSFVQTNLLTYSEAFDDASWTKALATVTANTAASPSGTTSADTFTETATTGNHALIQSGRTITAGSSLSFSMYVKNASGTRWAMLTVVGASGTAFCHFNPTTGAVGTSGVSGTYTNVSGQATNVGNGWYRFNVSMTTTTDTTVAPELRFKQTDGGVSSYAGDGTSGFYVWGAQLVQGASAGDYVRTEASTRAVVYTAPDGSLTADKAIATATGTSHTISLNAGTAASGTIFTFSVYAKAAEYGFIRLSLGNLAGGGYTFFDLTNGTIGSTGGQLSNAMVNVGNGWYRCSVTRAAASTNLIAGDIYLQSANTQFSWAGDGTSGVYIWGAQLSDSASLDSYAYNPGASPAAAAYYGPRFDYDPVTLAPKGLLIEEQRTNFIRNNTMQGAVAGTPGTLPTNWSFNTNGGLSTQVVSSGTEAGISYVDVRLFGTTTGASSLQYEANTQTAALSGQTWAISHYVKVIAGEVPAAASVRHRIVERSAAGAYLTEGNTVLVPAGASSSLASSRVSYAYTLANASTAFVVPALLFNWSAGVVVDVTLRVGMPQLEQGAFATSVIPTTTAQVTRAADVATMTGANFSNWYNQTEGTMYLDANTLGPRTVDFTFLRIDDGTSSNRIQVGTGASATVFNSFVVNASASQGPNTVSVSPVGAARAAFAYATNSSVAAANGTVGTTDTSVVVPSGVNRLLFGRDDTAFYLNGTIRRIAYYPRRLSNTELQGITA